MTTHGCAWLLQDRGYVVKEGRALRPESRGRVLSSFLHAFFPQYVDYGFTASLEDQLDEVSGPAPQLSPMDPSKGHRCSEERIAVVLEAQICHAACAEASHWPLTHKHAVACSAKLCVGQQGSREVQLSIPRRASPAAHRAAHQKS